MPPLSSIPPSSLPKMPLHGPIPHLPALGSFPSPSSVNHAVSSINEIGHPPVTSIHELDQERHAPITSLGDTSQVKYSVNDTQSATDTEAQLRHEYAVRHRIKEEAKTKHSSDPDVLHVHGTGIEFHNKGVLGFDRTERKFLKAHRTDIAAGIYNQKEEKILHDEISDRLHHKAVGKKPTWKDRKMIKDDLQKKYEEGKVSSLRKLQNMKKIVDKLDVN